MINPKFQWPDSIPVGHRSYSSSSSIISKSVSQVNLITTDGTIVDLLHDKYHSETERLVLICATVGVFSGVRNSMHAGFTCAACLNATDELKKAATDNEGPYKDCTIEIEWEAKSKAPVTISVEHLMDLTFLLSHVIIDSGGKVTTEVEKSTRSTRSKSTEQTSSLTKEQLMERFRSTA